VKILLTGATGFLGSQLLRSFLNNGHELTILVRHESNIKKISNFLKKVNIRHIENNVFEQLFNKGNNIDLVVHAATDYAYEAINPISPFWGNVDFPMRLLESAINNGTPMFINIDTFFNSKKNSYGYLAGYTLSKRHFQEWGMYASGKVAIGFVNLRLFHVYGPEDNERKFVPTIINKCLSGGEVDLTLGEQRRDFIYIDDVVEAVRLVATSTLGYGYHHFDVGSGETMRIRDFVEMVNQVCGNKATLNFGAIEMRAGELANSCADTSRLKSMGWRKRVDIKVGLQSVVASLKNQD
jgi:CDP-paratose synthetase